MHFAWPILSLNTHLGYSLVRYLCNLPVNLKQQTGIVQLSETNFMHSRNAVM